MGPVLAGWVCPWRDGGDWNTAPGDPEPRVPRQEYTAAEQQVQQQMSLGKLCHPVPHSFEPVKSFFKDLVGAMQSLLQTPLDVRLKESKSLCPPLGPSLRWCRH